MGKLKQFEAIRLLLLQPACGSYETVEEESERDWGTDPYDTCPRKPLLFFT